MNHGIDKRLENGPYRKLGDVNPRRRFDRIDAHVSVDKTNSLQYLGIQRTANVPRIQLVCRSSTGASISNRLNIGIRHQTLRILRRHQDAGNRRTQHASDILCGKMNLAQKGKFVGIGLQCTESVIERRLQIRHLSRRDDLLVKANDSRLAFLLKKPR